MVYCVFLKKSLFSDAFISMSLRDHDFCKQSVQLIQESKT